MHTNQIHKFIWKPKFIKNKKYSWKNDKNLRSQPPREEEDWEKEIVLWSIEEKKNKDPYDSGDKLNTPDMALCNVQNSASLNQDHYSPAVHHTQPVKWVRCIYTTVDDQFADADE